MNRTFRKHDTATSGATLLVGLIAALALAACQSPAIVRVRGLQPAALPVHEFLKIDFADPKSDVSLDFATLAAIAANVYEPEDVYDPTCSADKPGRIPLEGWEQLKGWSYPEACNRALNNLHYEVWSRVDAHGIGYQVIAFRGTAELVHWCSNFRDLEICQPKSDQYLSVGPLVDDVLSGIYDEWGPDRYTVAIGHSLGGGLAELAGRSSFIDVVVGFDPSPVTASRLSSWLKSGLEVRDFEEQYRTLTGCTYARNSGRTDNRLVVHRVYEHGEILAYPRMIKRWMPGSAPGDSRAIEYRTNLLGGNPFSQHRMKALACALRGKGAVVPGVGTSIEHLPRNAGAAGGPRPEVDTSAFDHRR